MIEFFQTKMGQRFYESTMPRLVDALEKINGKMDGLPKEGADQDYVVPLAVAKAGFWLTVGKASIHIKDGDEGVSVAVYAKDAEMEAAIGETWVTHGELEGEDTE